MNRVFAISVGLWLAGWGVVAACSDDDTKSACGDGTCDAGETAASCPDDCGCGNGIIDEGEECDGSELAGRDCESLDFAGGSLGCTAECRFETSRCSGGDPCGNGIIDQGEECDGSELAGQDCQALGFAAGTLACSDQCRLDTSACTQPGTGAPVLLFSDLTSGPATGWDGSSTQGAAVTIWGENLIHPEPSGCSRPRLVRRSSTTTTW